MQVVRDIMTTTVVTLDPAMTLREAATMFADHHVSGAPVVANGRVVGVLSASDILGAEAGPTMRDEDFDTGEPDLLDDDDDGSLAPFFSRLWPDAAMDVDERFGAGRNADRAGGSSLLDDRTVSDAMTRTVLEVRPDASIGLAADRMATSSVHRLLVIDDDGLAGIITTTDIARWLAGRLKALR